MSNKDFIALLTLIIGGLAYTITSFAYMHSNFIDKDKFEMLLHRLDRIERKVDNLKR